MILTDLVKLQVFADNVKDRIDIDSKNLSPKEKADSLNKLSYLNFTSHEKSIYYAEKALKISKEINYKKGEAEAYLYLGYTNTIAGKIDVGFEYYFKAETIYSNIGDNDGLARVWHMLSLGYRNKKDNAKWLEFAEKSRELNENIGNDKQLSSNFNNIGNIWFDRKDYDKALEYFRKGLNLRINIHDKSGEGNSYLSMAEVFIEINNLDSAKLYLDKSLEIKQSQNDIYGIARIDMLVGNIYEKKGDHEKALYYYTLSLELSLPNNYKSLILDGFKNLYLLYGKMGNYKEAYLNLMQHTAIKDSVFNDERNRRISELERQSAQKIQEKEEERLKIIIYSSIGGIIVLIIFILALIQRISYKNRTSNIITKQNEEISKQMEIIKSQNDNILAGIRYAEKIQEALLPTDEEIRSIVDDYFIIYLPRDIVSGDFYWFGKSGNKKIIALMDCTGHGVPGALMSVMGYEHLDEIINDRGISSPERILVELHNKVRQSLKQNLKESAQDGMDAAIVTIEENLITTDNIQIKEMVFEFAGAHRPLYYLLTQNGETNLYEIKGDRASIGGRQKEKERKFTKHIIKFPVVNNDNSTVNNRIVLYLSSDGYTDQNNEKDEKYGTVRFKNFLKELSEKNMLEQKENLEKELRNFSANVKKRDDITVIGLCLRF